MTLPAPVELELPADAGALYDPSQLVVPPADPALARRALDGKASTAFTITPSRPEWGVGYVVDLQKPHGLRTLEITTSTPGFRVEVYATDLATPPPTVTDARWAHLADRRAVERRRQARHAAARRRRDDLPDPPGVGHEGPRPGRPRRAGRAQGHALGAAVRGAGRWAARDP